MAKHPEEMKMFVGVLVALKLAMVAASVAASLTAGKLLVMAGVVTLLGYLFFEKPWASTFIEGLEKFAWVLVGLGVALVALAGIAKAANLDLDAFANVMKAVAIASLAGAAAFYIVTLSMDKLTDTLARANKLGVDVNKTLIILGLTITALAITFAVIAVKSTAAVPALLALGFAFVAIGAGAFIAATAFGMFIDHYERAKPDTLKALAEGLTVLALGMLAAGLAGKAGALGIGIFGGAVLAMGLGFKLAADSIASAREGMANLFMALGTIDTTELDIVAVKLEKIARAMDSVNETTVRHHTRDLCARSSRQRSSARPSIIEIRK